jgi:hypothetical protein
MIAKPNIDELVENDLLELVEGDVSEGLFIEYKTALYGGSDADKRELLKDVSAFANAHGGHLIIGMVEEGGVATALPGVAPEDIDAEVQRLDQIIRTGIEPRIPNCRIKFMRLSSDKYGIVIRVPRSWRVPHRISAQNTNRFWIRNSSGCHEASMDELRTLFGQMASVLDRARAFRDERIAQIVLGSDQRPLANDGRLIVHIVPYSAFFSIEPLEAEAIFDTRHTFSPMGSTGYSPRYNFDGVLIERGGETNYGYTQIFRSGIIEATKASLLRQSDERRSIAGLAMERDFFTHFTRYVEGLQGLGIDPPLLIMITLQGILGADYLVFYPPQPDAQVPLDRDTLSLPECVINEYGTLASYHQAVRPAFDALWNAIGYSKSQFFDGTGMWVGQPPAGGVIRQ